jgi:succinyl-CoA synthetase beta subunit
MKLIERDAKHLLRAYGIAVPAHAFLSIDDDHVAGACASVRFPVYLKPQVLQGRRGQSGWIRRCESEADVAVQIGELRRALGSTPCAGFLCEEAVPCVTEYLAGVDLDAQRGCYRASFSSNGGADVSGAATWPIVTEERIGQIPAPAHIRDVIFRLYDLVRSEDAISAEINPLVVRSDGSSVALDAKIELDDAAIFRHPERERFCTLSQTGKNLSERERAYLQLLENVGHRGTLGRYVELDGEIAVILSGGGASLVAMDALISAGGQPANYVEMSGNPDPASVYEASRIVFSKPGLKAVWIAGSFANFTNIQTTVNAALRAFQDSGLGIPVVIRRDGPNAEAARSDAIAWGRARGVPVQFDLADVDLNQSAQAVVALL